MKINGLKNQRIAAKGKSGKEKVKDSGFFDLLAGELAPPAATVSVPESGVVPETSTLPLGIRLNGVRLSESSIDLLEHFGRALGNLELKADDLAPMVQALEGDTTALLDIREQLPPDDPLARLIDQVTTISYIETEKFRRGDYRVP
jgi:hypothetical protein